MKKMLGWSIIIVLIIELVLYQNLAQENVSASTYEGIAYLESSTFSNSKNQNYEVITYTNPNNQPIEISTKDIVINCQGKGRTKEDDEYLVESNFAIDASFSKTRDGKRQSSITVDKKQTIYIHINSRYETTVYPSNEVTCDYQIKIETV